MSQKEWIAPRTHRFCERANVFFLDPCTGTGNYVVNLLRRISPRDLPRVYREQLFANEVMLLPYYIAAMNIEHEYFERTGNYEPFEGLCFVDTLELAEAEQAELSFMSEENTARVMRQKATPITVIIGNPPYNVGQLNENDNNKNRKYKILDSRVGATYSKDSKATLKSKLYDPYVKFFRWASDRLQGRDGVVCFISNNNFVNESSFDGMRKHLQSDFSTVMHLDLHGNVRKNPRLSGTTHNVFGIQVGVGITIAVRLSKQPAKRLLYHRVPENWRREEKLKWLADMQKSSFINWTTLTPDTNSNWLADENAATYTSLIPIGSKEAKAERFGTDEHTVFTTYSPGVKTNRDGVVFAFHFDNLSRRIEKACEDFDAEVGRYQRKGNVPNLDDFLDYSKVKWSRDLKERVKRGISSNYNPTKIRPALRHPFCKSYLYYDNVMIDSPGLFRYFLPTSASDSGNTLICVPGVGDRKGFGCLITNVIPNHDIAFEKSQCFPFYIYNADGTDRRENLTDWSLSEFRTHYDDSSITKWDIFYYVYGVLHLPSYREKFADNLKRELPRIPFVTDFRAFAKAGEQLADLHLNYEQTEPWPLTWIHADGKPLSYRIDDKMRLSKDKATLVVNESLSLGDIQPEAFSYRLGNRSALDWVIDQYQVSEDKRSGIKTDPNREDDPEYIVRLVGQVVRVSVETNRIVNGLADQDNIRATSVQ